MEEESNKKRRITDMFSDDTDHDLLIKHSVKIDNVCKLVHSVNEKLDKGNFVSDSMFKWIIGMIILIIVSMVAVIGVNQVSISKNFGLINNLDENVKSNNDKIKKFDEIFYNFMREEHFLGP